MTEPVSEEEFIQRYMLPLAAGNPGALGLTDDCALLTVSPGCELVMKTDAIAEGIHFLPDDPPADIGWKALAVNVSDLAAKGAKPLTYLLSLAFPAAPSAQFMAGLTAGLAEAQQAFGLQLAGGDTDRRPGPLTITPFVLGEVAAGTMVRRATARPGDLLYVSGTLGDAALGLAALTEPDLSAAWGLAAPERAHLVARYRRPRPRLALRGALLAHARAAMDLSDGLAKDAARMAAASGIAMRIETARVPLSAAAAKVMTTDESRIASIVAAGDDYEILAAIPPAAAQAFERDAAAAGVAVAAIGHCTPGRGVHLEGPSGPLALTSTGWDHFAR